MEVVNFKAEHLDYMLKTGIHDVNIRPWLLPDHGPALEKFGGTFTILDEGIPVVFGGIIKYWNNRGEAWLVFGNPKAQSFLSIFRIIKKFIKDCPLKRIEMTIDYGSEVHTKWAEMLGFKKEADRLRCYKPGGQDASLYAMVKE